MVRKTLTALAAALVAASLIAVSPTPAAASADPSANGPYTVDEIDYKAGYVTVSDPYGVTIVEELKGSIHLPEDAPGLRPIVVFLHGRHSTCRIADEVETPAFGWPCPEAPPATSDVTSYRGYDYLAHNLATHGYVVVSISANAINAYDLALLLTDSGMRMRAELVAHTLDRLKEWNEQTGPREVGRRLVDKLDFDRIGLMGHSRGGEGVARFVTYNKNRGDGPRYKGLRAVFTLAPTDVGDPRVPGVHFGTLLPLCDGDVYDLQGAPMFDRARFLNPERFARVQFTVNGANHNFFNTVWTFDDGQRGGDGSGINPSCMQDHRTSVRLTAQEQRKVGLVLMAAFLRRYVGGETQFDSLMTGHTSLPASACPNTSLPCSRIVGTSYVGPEKERDIFLLPKAKGGYSARGFEEVQVCQPATFGDGQCPTQPTRSIARQLALSWKQKATLKVSLGSENVARYSALTFRLGVNFQSELNQPQKPQDFDVALIDGSGRSASVSAKAYSNALWPAVGKENQQLTLNGVRIPLAAFNGINLSDVRAVELRFGQATKSGAIQLAELAVQ